MHLCCKSINHVNILLTNAERVAKVISLFLNEAFDYAKSIARDQLYTLSTLSVFGSVNKR